VELLRHRRVRNVARRATAATTATATTATTDARTREVEDRLDLGRARERVELHGRVGAESRLEVLHAGGVVTHPADGDHTEVQVRARERWSVDVAPLGDL
jgi:hypothetical protein